MPNSFTQRFVRDYSGNQDRKGFGLPVLASTAGRSCCKLASTRIQTETWIRPSLLWFLCLLTFSPGGKKWNCLHLLYLYFGPCHALLPSPEVQEEIQAVPQPAAEWLGIQEQRCSQPCWEKVLLSLEYGSAGELSSVKWPSMPVTTLKQRIRRATTWPTRSLVPECSDPSSPLPTDAGEFRDISLPGQLSHT